MNMRETCWEQINWLELVNTSSQAINASVIFRSATGGNIDTSAVLLPARGQFHLNASAVLGSTRELGSAEISATPTGALIAQSSVYYLSCNSSTLFSGFAIQAENKTQAPIVGSFNRFLALENQLITFGVKNGARSVALDLRSNGGAVIHQSSESLNSYRALQLNLNDSTYGTAADTYGLVTLTPSQSESILSFNLRVRKSGTANREIDFVVPTTLR